MAGLFAFEPDGARGLAVDAQVRARLADSLDQLVAAARERLPMDAAGLKALCRTVRARPVRPGVMVLYADAVPALLSGDDAAATHILTALALPHWRDPAPARVVSLHDAELGPGMAARYRAQLLDDPDNQAAFDALDDAQMDHGRQAVADAHALLAAAAPELAAEIAALAPEILLVATARQPGGLVFHGASSFFIWGAVALNLAEHPTRVKMVEGLAHEAAHGLLHGLTLGAPLVENEPAQRYPSPLRDDPRPMDGLVHAAFVLARMHAAMDAVARAPAAAPAEREEAARRCRDAGRSFAAAVQTIDAHARFTADGAAIFAGAASFMAQRRAAAPDAFH